MNIKLHVSFQLVFLFLKKKTHPGVDLLGHTVVLASLVAQIVKNLPAMWETQVWSLGWKDLWRREWLPTPVFLPGEFHGQRSLVGYSPWGCKESDMTEWLTHTHSSSTFSFFLRKLHSIFLTVAAPIYMPTNNAGRFPSLNILAIIYYLYSFWQ